MSVDKSRFRRQQIDTYDFYRGVHAPDSWKSDEQIERYVPTHCCYCGVQCGMYLKVTDGKVVGVEPREDFPLNHGMLCPKGTTAYQTVNHPDRLTYPLMRRGGKNSLLERVSWDEALDTVVQAFQGIQAESGKDAVAVYSGSSMTNEKCYLMGKFARVALGTRHVDYNGRLCMSSATGANERSLGIDRAANPISDMLHADCIFVIGANVGECFPIVTSYLWQARDRGCKLIVADPRQTPIARTADIFLPLRSGTDSALLNGMLHVIIKEGSVDEAFIRERNYVVMTEQDDKLDLLALVEEASLGKLTELPEATATHNADSWVDADTADIPQRVAPPQPWTPRTPLEPAPIHTTSSPGQNTAVLSRIHGS